MTVCEPVHLSSGASQARQGGHTIVPCVTRHNYTATYVAHDAVRSIAIGFGFVVLKTPSPCSTKRGQLTRTRLDVVASSNLYHTTTLSVGPPKVPWPLTEAARHKQTRVHTISISHNRDLAAARPGLARNFRGIGRAGAVLP